MGHSFIAGGSDTPVEDLLQTFVGLCLGEFFPQPVKPIEVTSSRQVSGERGVSLRGSG
jgi:hypothetical protein